MRIKFVLASLLLEPGKYFVAFQIVGYDEHALGEMKPLPVNIGIVVKGLEYRE